MLPFRQKWRFVSPSYVILSSSDVIVSSQVHKWRYRLDGFQIFSGEDLKSEFLF
jgi:hypothetical protein